MRRTKSYIDRQRRVTTERSRRLVAQETSRRDFRVVAVVVNGVAVGNVARAGLLAFRSGFRVKSRDRGERGVRGEERHAVDRVVENILVTALSVYQLYFIICCDRPFVLQGERKGFRAAHRDTVEGQGIAWKCTHFAL